MITDFMASSKAKWKKFTQNRKRLETALRKEVKRFDKVEAKYDKAKAYREESGERVILHKIKIIEREIKKANRENKEISQAVHTNLFNIRHYAQKFNRPKLEREVKRLIKLMKNP